MSGPQAGTAKLSTHLLKGWLEIPKRSLSANLRFFKLRGNLDPNSNKPTSVQLISRHDRSSDMGRLISSLTPESCVAVSVNKVERPSKAQRTTAGIDGEFEYEIVDLEVLNMAAKNLPFVPNLTQIMSGQLRAQHRHLELRSEKCITVLHERARLRKELRSSLEEQGFLEVETPLLFKSTPEGAREFLVPTRTRGQFYALPQSPQQYKQILMAGGIHRYYQFAKCFRDEDSRADRQPEFTQLDLEMAFVDMEEVMAAISKTILTLDDGKIFKLEQGTIRRIKYQTAMETYGSDKPDTRFDLEIQTILKNNQGELMTDAVDVIEYRLDSKRRYDKNEFKNFQKSLQKISVYAVTRTSTSDFDLPEFQDVRKQLPKWTRNTTKALLLLSRRPKGLSGGSTNMGQARLLLQAFLEREKLEPIRADRPFHLCWVTDFPLFSPSSENEPGQGGTHGLTSTHHPFTAPHPDDVELLSGSTEDVRKIRGLHYDLVMNGVEIGGGSIRIHNAKQQRLVFQVLGMSEARISQFDHLLGVLESGCPPHGGFALGFDRFVAMMCGRQSIREVIAFPKSSSGVDALVGSPSSVDDATLKEYHIKLTDP